MKICIPTISMDGLKLTNLGFIPFLEKNHTVTEHCQTGYDLIFNMSAFEYKHAEQMGKDYGVPIVNYVWDFYKWAYDGKHPFDWKGYGEYLKKSKLVIVPSEAQKLRLKELLGIDAVVVKTGHKMFEAEVTDGGFVLDHMRWYEEENKRWAVTACDTQLIPVVHSEHKVERAEFEKLVANCRFLVCGYREASTGGLTILEGLWLGKPVLLSNSPYQGGRDYAGEFATYFQYDDYNDLKKKIKEMYLNPPKIDIQAVRKYITENFSYQKMAENLQLEFLKVCSKT